MSTPKPFEISKQIVWEAWQCVRRNAGSFGVDKESIEDVEKDLKGNLYKLWNRMSSGSYLPPAIRGVDIPKKQGGTRRLGIPTVLDRVAQATAKLWLEPKIEPQFHNNSFGYRPCRSAHDAIELTKRRCWEHPWVLEYDIKGMFDNIPHDLIMKALRHHIEEKWVLLYVERWLTAPMVEPETGKTTARTKGTPQGGVISPLLSNLYMHYVFDKWMDREFPTLPWCRYADDGLIHCQSKSLGEHLKSRLKARFEECGLELHPTKTRLIYCQDGFRKGKEENREFTFLGFDFKARNAKSRTKNVIFRSFQPAVSLLGLNKMRHKIKHEWKLGSKVELSLEQLAEMMNPVIQGWLNYYGKFYPSEMYKICRYLNQTLGLWARRKYKRLYRRFQNRSEFVKFMYDKTPKLFAHWKFMKVY
jgi:RNA-directed DNA polymerase